MDTYHGGLMSFLEKIGFTGFGAKNTEVELPALFPLSIAENSFIEMDIETIYARILTDVLERTQNIPDDKKVLLWDSCLASEKSDGLVTLLVKAMYNKGELFIVYDSATNVVRKANQTEQATIKADYEKQGKSTQGVYLTFKNYKRTDMLKVYSVLEYCAIGGLNKSMNLSTALQFKMNDLRASVATVDAGITQAQAVAVAEALKKGRGALLDGKDTIELAKPDLTATTSAMEFISEKKSFYLGMPASYITGDLPGGLGDSGNGDAKAVERGLRGYYFSIIKPTVEALFGIKTEFETEDYAQISTTLEVIRTFELVSDELVSQDNKLIIVNRLLGLPDDTKGGAPAPTPNQRDVTGSIPAPAPQA